MFKIDRVIKQAEYNIILSHLQERWPYITMQHIDTYYKMDPKVGMEIIDSKKRNRVGVVSDCRLDS